MLDAAGLRDRAWLPGERDDIPEILRGLDCFVLPSLAEGISNTILEAMASGLPIVATRVGGNAELVEDGLTGRLVPAANPDVDGGGDRRATSRTRRPRVGMHGRPRLAAVRNFSLDRMVAEYRSLYDGLLARRVATAARSGAGG